MCLEHNKLLVHDNLCCVYFRDEAETLAKKLRVKFYRTSVKENLNVSEGKKDIDVVIEQW